MRLHVALPGPGDGCSYHIAVVIDTANRRVPSEVYSINNARFWYLEDWRCAHSWHLGDWPRV